MKHTIFIAITLMAGLAWGQTEPTVDISNWDSLTAAGWTQEPTPCPDGIIGCLVRHVRWVPPQKTKDYLPNYSIKPNNWGGIETTQVLPRPNAITIADLAAWIKHCYNDSTIELYTPIDTTDIAGYLKISKMQAVIKRVTHKNPNDIGELVKWLNEDKSQKNVITDNP